MCNIDDLADHFSDIPSVLHSKIACLASDRDPAVTIILFRFPLVKARSKTMPKSPIITVIYSYLGAFVCHDKCP